MREHLSHWHSFQRHWPAWPFTGTTKPWLRQREHLGVRSAAFAAAAASSPSMAQQSWLSTLAPRAAPHGFYLGHAAAPECSKWGRRGRRVRGGGGSALPRQPAARPPAPRRGAGWSQTDLRLSSGGLEGQRVGWCLREKCCMFRAVPCAGARRDGELWMGRVCMAQKGSVPYRTAWCESFPSWHFNVHTRFHTARAFVLICTGFQFCLVPDLQHASLDQEEWLAQQKNPMLFHHSVFQNQVLRWRQKAYVIWKTCLLFLEFLILWEWRQAFN